MHVLKFIFLLFFIVCNCYNAVAQQDTAVQKITDLSTKYLSQVNNKIDKYSNRVTNKTEKTLTKLAKWENKIKNLLQKADPQTAERLFGNGAISFTTMLQKVKEGKQVVANYKANYDEYNDKLTTSIKYIDEQKAQLNTNYVKPIKAAKANLQKLDSTTTQAEAITKLIKERKQQLIDAAVKVLGKSKYLRKINEESYYYVETLRNYKTLFQDKKKAEETALKVLHKIPAFEKFAAENSVLASLFGSPSPVASGASLAGLQTRASVNALIQNTISAGGPNAAAAVSQNMQAAQAQLRSIKDKMLMAGVSNSEDMDLTPNPSPGGEGSKNMQKTKTFAQRIEYGTNFNISKPSAIQPNAADIALSIGYKLNDKSEVGLGASYKMGFGTISNLKFTSEGIGLRSFIDWKAPFEKLKVGVLKGILISGGYEMNYNNAFKNIATLQNLDVWQSSGLLGITKKTKLSSPIGGKSGSTKIQLLYDMLHKTHTPVTQPVIFRVGYNF